MTHVQTMRRAMLLRTLPMSPSRDFDSECGRGASSRRTSRGKSMRSERPSYDRSTPKLERPMAETGRGRYSLHRQNTKVISQTTARPSLSLLFHVPILRRAKQNRTDQICIYDQAIWHIYFFSRELRERTSGTAFGKSGSLESLLRTHAV